MDRTPEEYLERLIDETSLEDVMVALQKICHEKCQRSLTSFNSLDELAQGWPWNKASKVLTVTNRVIHKLGV